MEKAYVSNRIIKNYFLYHINSQLYNHIILIFFFFKSKLTCSQKSNSNSNSNTHTPTKKKKSQPPNYVSIRNILIYPINKKRKEIKLKIFPENKHGLIK